MNGQVVYKLQGKSLEAAKELEKFAESYWKAQPPVVYPINMLDLQNHSRAIYAGMLEKLQEERPDLAKACGLDKPVTKVQTGLDAYPRAYVAWPEIYSSYMGPRSEYFMYAPVGHDGSVFEPEDAIALDEKQADRAGNLLWAGGWQDNAPFAHRPDHGVALPADFDPKSEHAVQRHAFVDDNTTVRVFKAGGPSLAALEDLKAREEAHNAAISALFDHVKDMAPATVDLPARKGKPARTAEVYANLSLTENDDGEPIVMLSLRLKGDDNIMEAGQPVHVKDTDGYIVSGPGHGGDVEIVPNLNSEAGKKFRDLLADPNIARPDVRNYPVLRYPATDAGIGSQFAAAAETYEGFPVRNTFNGEEYLIYRRDRDDNPDLPGPPGAIPVSVQTFHWLNSDESDIRQGITLPPMPPEIAAELEKLKPQNPGAAPLPPLP